MTHYQSRIILTTLLAMLALGVWGQRPQIFSTRIKTLQTVAGQKWTSMPIIALGGDEVVNIDFDDLTHESHRYAYRIEHCDAEWNASTGLFESDYIDGFAEGNLIDDLQESLNTNTLYTHYHFSVPNSRCSLKLSGNYRVTVYDENEGDKPILQTCFMVAEPAVSIALHGPRTEYPLPAGGHGDKLWQPARNRLAARDKDPSRPERALGQCRRKRPGSVHPSRRSDMGPLPSVYL